MSPRRPTPPADELRERLGSNLRGRREELGISQEELSLRAELSLTAIYPVELGRRVPKIDTFIRLVGALETTPGALSAGIVWVPAERVVSPGEFEVPEDLELAAEVAGLREDEASPEGASKK
ncbi:MAG: helix-turn-helix transcriptional regulator [Thermoleophilia bacterium]|nr:helix-turn-helix transcriptional regulator [Thermoleophilia bacterium]